MGAAHPQPRCKCSFPGLNLAALPGGAGAQTPLCNVIVHSGSLSMLRILSLLSWFYTSLYQSGVKQPLQCFLTRAPSHPEHPSRWCSAAEGMEFDFRCINGKCGGIKFRHCFFLHLSFLSILILATDFSQVHSSVQRPLGWLQHLATSRRNIKHGLSLYRKSLPS